MAVININILANFNFYLLWPFGKIYNRPGHRKVKKNNTIFQGAPTWKYVSLYKSSKNANVGMFVIYILYPISLHLKYFTNVKINKGILAG